MSSLKIKFQCYAPNKPQNDVVNHLTGESVNETRNALVESARIARGQVKDLSLLSANNYDALMFPGGFGVTKTLSNFASQNENFKLDENVEKILKEFHEQKKLLGFISISPILAAKVFGKQSGGNGCAITLGAEGDNSPYSSAISIIIMRNF